MSGEGAVYEVRTTNRANPMEKYVSSSSAQGAAQISGIMGWVKVTNGSSGSVHEFLVTMSVVIPRGDPRIKHFQGPAYSRDD